jgi:hypothetical protein
MPFRVLWCLAFCLLACGCVKAKKKVDDSPPNDSGPAPAVGAPGAGPGPKEQTDQKPKAAGVKYVPRVSEKKLQDYLNGLDPKASAAVTDEQVYAIMGEPTRRDAPVTGRKNGQVFTVYKAYWEEPGSGVSSSVVFANGRMSGMVLGLESPKKPAGK